MKKVLTITIICALCALFPLSVFADPVTVKSEIIEIGGGYYLETVISDDESPVESNIQQQKTKRVFSKAAKKTTKTKSKTGFVKNSASKVMWYVKVTGTFTYGNGKSVCTNSVCTAESKNKYWKVSNKSASRSGSKASASATGTHFGYNGIITESITKSITLTCSPTGVFS